MMLDRAGIERLAPQRGAMCLLDAVLQWDRASIRCVAAPPSSAHPLARHGAVPAVAAVEYAAQATAVHGALVEADTAPRAGMLVKLSEVHLHTKNIPSEGEQLTVQAEQLGRGNDGCIYAFEVSCHRQPVACGRLMVAFAAPVAR